MTKTQSRLAALLSLAALLVCGFGLASSIETDAVMGDAGTVAVAGIEGEDDIPMPRV